ncbi:MAG: diguanylate cyclase [Nannocystaceae bacterium]
MVQVDDPPESKPLILVADDEPTTRGFVASVLRRNNMLVEEVEDGQKAVERATRGDVDLVVLDAVMPRLGGFEACRIIKAASGSHFLPIILVTIQNDTSSRVAGLRIGADDYIGKPFDERELMARVRSLLRVKKMHDDLTEAKRALEELAVHDELTGLHNFRYLRTRLEDEFRRSMRYRDPLTCVMIDVDHFKKVNDQHGHAVGDAVLVEVARRLRAGVREVDAVARYGGEEFLLLLPSTPSEGGGVGGGAHPGSSWRDAHRRRRAVAGRHRVGRRSHCAGGVARYEGRTSQGCGCCPVQGQGERAQPSVCVRGEAYGRRSGDGIGRLSAHERRFGARAR